jgi:hypothetical protein
VSTHRRVFFLTSVLVLALAAPAAAQIGTTRELDITVTDEDLTVAIEETHEFWGPVRRYLDGSEFQVADAATRTKAIAFTKRVHDSLHNRLFESDDETAQDLLVFLGMRLRKFTLYRRLREAVGDDAALAELVRDFERTNRDIHHQAEDQRQSLVDRALAAWPARLAAAGLSSDVVARSMPLWQQQATCFSITCRTQAGQMMLAFDRENQQAPAEVRDLVAAIADTADWVLITRQADAKIGRDDFVRAWEELAAFRTRSRTAARTPAAGG